MHNIVYQRRTFDIYVYTETEYSDFNDFHINIRGWIIIHHVIKALITLQFSWFIFRKILAVHNGKVTEKGMVY